VGSGLKRRPGFCQITGGGVKEGGWRVAFRGGSVVMLFCGCRTYLDVGSPASLCIGRGKGGNKAECRCLIQLHSGPKSVEGRKDTKTLTGQVTPKFVVRDNNEPRGVITSTDTVCGGWVLGRMGKDRVTKM